MWAASDTFEIGDLYVGVRSHPAELSSWIRMILADHLAEHVDAPPNYSVRLEERGPGREGTRAYTLYRGRCLLLRTRMQQLLLRALARSLSAHAGTLDGLLRIRQLAVVGEFGALILPHELYRQLEGLEQRLAANAMWLADPPLIEIDTERGELIVAPPALELGSSEPGSEPHRAAPNGNYRIREWAILGRDDEEPPTTEEALASVMSLVEEDGNPSSALGAILGVLSDTRVTRIRRDRPAELWEWLSARGA